MARKKLGVGVGILPRSLRCALAKGASASVGMTMVGSADAEELARSQRYVEEKDDANRIGEHLRFKNLHSGVGELILLCDYKMRVR